MYKKKNIEKSHKRLLKQARTDIKEIPLSAHIKSNKQNCCADLKAWFDFYKESNDTTTNDNGDDYQVHYEEELSSLSDVDLIDQIIRIIMEKVKNYLG